MTTRLLVVAAIPLAGLLLLLGGLLLLGDEETRVRYEGREYRGGGVAVVPADAAPTGDRVEGRQVWLAPGDDERLWLQLPDGRFQVFQADG